MNIHFADLEGIIRETLDMGKSFKISPNGQSMLPLLLQGRDSVYITKPKGRLKKYDIAFFKRRNGSFVLHRVVKVKKNSYCFCGDNQWAVETKVFDDMIIGVVSEIERDGKRFPVTDPDYIAYSKKVVNSRFIKNYKLIIPNNIKRAKNKLFGR